MKPIKYFCGILLPALFLLVSCNRDDFNLEIDNIFPPTENPEINEGIARSNIQPVILGEQKNNPFSIENMKAALEMIIQYGDEDELGISTRTARSLLLELPPTDWYVRFLPADTIQLQTLMQDEYLQLFDFPLDFEIVQHGDYFIDPTLDGTPFTWLYTVVKPGYVPPDGIHFEILEKLFVPENSELYTATEIDSFEIGTRSTVRRLRQTETAEDFENRNLLDAMLRVSFELTGNGHELEREENSLKSSITVCQRRCVLFVCWNDCTTYWRPTGTIRVVNPNGTAVPVRGVKVRVWRWFTIKTTYTNVHGVYNFPQFSELLIGNNLNYKVIFEGRHTSGIRWELSRTILWAVPVWTAGYGMGTHSPAGRSLTFQRNSSRWGLCILNNAIFDYCTQAQIDGISLPPHRLEIATRNIENAGNWTSSAPLLRNHINTSIIRGIPGGTGTVLSALGGVFTLLDLVPDLILRYSNNSSNDVHFRNIHLFAWHELTHASQYQRMRNDRGLLWASDYWSENVYRQARNSITSKDDDGNRNPYGERGGTSWQVIALSEGWANYRTNLLLSRVGMRREWISGFPRIYANMFQELADIGIPQGEMERALSAWTFAAYRDNLIARLPHRRAEITEIVNRYYARTNF